MLAAKVLMNSAMKCLLILTSQNYMISPILMIVSLV